MTDDIDIELERAIADAATEGPWFTPDERRLQGAVSARIGERECQVASIDGDAAMFDRRAETHEIQRANAAFIARARTLVPRLLDALEQARKERDEAQRQHAGRVRQVEKLERRLAVEDAFKLKIKSGLKDAWKGERKLLREAAVRYRAERDSIVAERDALRQQLEAVTRERDEARAELNRLRATTVRQVADETAEAIASWLAASRADDDFDPDVRAIAARIRAGSWRAKEGK